MSGTAGATLIGIPLLLGIVGSLIAAAVAAVLVGGAVLAAGSVLVNAAKRINKAARAIHQGRIQTSIDNQRRTSATAGSAGIKVINNHGLAQQVATQRQKMLDMYNSMSDQIDRAAQNEADERDQLLQQARHIESQGRQKLEQVQENLHRFNRQNADQLKTVIVQAKNTAEQQLRSWSLSVQQELEQRKVQFQKRIENVERQLDRDRIGLEFASGMYAEAQELHRQLIGQQDAEALVGGQLKMLAQIQKDYSDLTSRGQGQAAIGVSVSYVQQVMETWIKLDAERHQRQLLLEQLEVSAASLRAFVENGGKIDFEHAKKFPKETDYWAEGEFSPLLQEGRELLARIDEAKKQSGKLKAAEVESLLSGVSGCTERLSKVHEKASECFVNSYLRMQMLKKAQAGFAASGWKVQGWGYEQKDFRKALVMRFTRDGATADLLLEPEYDSASGRYEVRVSVERQDAGVIDEKLRQAQIQQLEKNLKEQGLPVSDMHCEAGTAGKNAAGPAINNRFEIPNEQ